jgi:hypothetical protein
MCKPFSLIITKNQHVYTHPDPLVHSHTEIMDHFNLRESNKDPRFNSFVKIETYPKDNKSLLTTPINEWDIIVDEDCIPSWYEDDRESYETIIKKEIQSWLNRLKDINWNKKTLRACYCCLYAKDILKGRFILGEKIIAKSADYSYLYAKDVLKGPFPLGEASIAKYAYYGCLYATYVLKGRFKKGEAAIATDVLYSYFYARDVLKKRFQSGEVAIAKDAMYSYWYVRDVLKKRFKLGEEIISTDAYFKNKYEELFNCTLGEK